VAAPGKVLVLGLGNDILTDDAVGLRVVRLVGERLAGERDIRVRETMEMGLALLDEIEGCDALVLVDAVQTGRVEPGHCHEPTLDEVPRVASTSPHFLGVGETLALGRQLGLTMPGRVRIFAIEVADARTLGEGLTEPVARALAPTVERVVEASLALAGEGGATARGASQAAVSWP